MNKLIPLMILATVVSCGKKSSQVDGVEMIVNKLSDSQKIGLVSLTTSTGEGANFSVNDENKIDGFKRESYTDTTKKIILKKEYSLVYSLEITKDEGQPERRMVILEDIADSNDELRKMIDSGKAEVKGDNLVITLEDESSSGVESDTVSYSIRSKMKIKYSKNLKSACESKTEIKMTDVIGTISGVETKLEDGTATSTEVCGVPLTKEELKALDLSEIRFCDDRLEDNNCEDKKDMSFLTADL